MTNDCQNLDAYLNGELTPGEDAHFAAHLAGCPACREAVDEQQWIDGLLREPAIAQLEKPSTALVESVRGTLARRLQTRRRLVAAAAAAAVLFVAAGLGTLLKPQTVETRVEMVAVVGAMPDAHPFQPAMFVGGPDVIVMPVESAHPDVTIVRVYPTYEPDYSVQASVDQSTTSDDLAWPDLNGG